MELCDVYDESGAHIGRTAMRGTELLQGEYYLVVQVWIRNEDGEYLVQQRALHLVSGPGMWATTAGFVLAGEESVAGAIREVNEELGLQIFPEQLRRFDRLFLNGWMQDVWVADVHKHPLGVPTLGEEVADWKWVSKAELEQMVQRGDFYAYSYLSDLLNKDSR